MHDEDLPKALEPSIWPLRVKVRQYIYFAKKKTDETPNANAKSSTPTQQVPQVLVHPPSNRSPITILNRFSPLAGIQNLTPQ